MRIKELAHALIGLVILSGCMSGGGTRIDNIPMYGQPEIVRPEFLKKADEEFIERALGGFVNREEASKAWWHQAEQFMKEGNLDYAMRRYNQSWLLNPNNYQPYWGFARVMVVRRQYEESFKYFKKAIDLINDPYEKPALLSDTAIAHHNKAYNTNENNVQERNKYFALANNYFKESTISDPTYPNSWAGWAYSLYFQGKYLEAWSKVKKTRQLNPSLLDARMLTDLSNAMPEPK